MKNRKDVEIITNTIVYFLKENNIKLDSYCYGKIDRAIYDYDIIIDCYLPKNKINLITQENFKINCSILIESNPYEIEEDSNKLKQLSRIKINLI